MNIGSLGFFNKIIASFIYDGIKIYLIPSQMLKYNDNTYYKILPDGLKVELIIQHPQTFTFSWYLTFSDSNTSASKHIYSVQSADITLPFANIVEYHTLLRNPDTKCFIPFEKILSSGEIVTISASSEISANDFPFIDLNDNTDSYFLCLNQNAEWKCSLNTFQNSVNIKVSLPDSPLILQPDQSISSPSVSLTKGNFYNFTHSSYTPYTTDKTGWTAYQFALCDSGFCTFYRLDNSLISAKVFKINDVSDKSKYNIKLTYNYGSSTSFTASGSYLKNGIRISLPHKKESCMLKYSLKM